jgi:SpoVK/Ycf46/Vps4 family AAA+-type ATPase
LAPDVDLVALSQQCPFNFSGADFYALCSDALLMAYKRKTVEVEERASASGLTVRQVLSEMHASDIRGLSCIFGLDVCRKCLIRFGVCSFQCSSVQPISTNRWRA